MGQKQTKLSNYDSLFVVTAYTKDLCISFFNISNDIHQISQINQIINDYYYVLHRETIKYSNNKVDVDCVETINASLAPNGDLLQGEIVSTIIFKPHLSGVPTITFGFKTNISTLSIDNIKFHRYVDMKQTKMENDLVSATFIPPKNEFKLLEYTTKYSIKSPLISVESSDISSNSTVKCLFKLRMNTHHTFKGRKAEYIEIFIPTTNRTNNLMILSKTNIFKAKMGIVKYIPHNNCLKWQLKNLHFPKNKKTGKHEYLMYAPYECIDKTSPIRIKFKIPYLGLTQQVHFVKIIEKSGYQALPWVHYFVQSGDYTINQGGGYCPPSLF